MSARRLRYWVLASVIWLLMYAICFVVLDLKEYKADAERMKTLIPLAVALPTAALAAAFTRRNSYLQGLRELWSKLIPAVQSAIQFTHLTSPDQVAFAKTQEALATAIDLIRGVFKNVPAKNDQKGLFPYENLKDIQEIISHLGYGENFRGESASQARVCITRLWQEMHSAMLAEFDRDTPEHPVSKYFGSGRSLADLYIAGKLKPEHLRKERRPSDPGAT